MLANEAHRELYRVPIYKKGLSVENFTPIVWAEISSRALERPGNISEKDFIPGNHFLPARQYHMGGFGRVRKKGSTKCLDPRNGAKEHPRCWCWGRVRRTHIFTHNLEELLGAEDSQSLQCGRNHLWPVLGLCLVK